MCIQLDCIMCVYSTRLEVRKHGHVVHTIQDCQFINSPEWIMSQDVPYIFEASVNTAQHPFYLIKVSIESGMGGGGFGGAYRQTP